MSEFGDSGDSGEDEPGTPDESGIAEFPGCTIEVPAQKPAFLSLFRGVVAVAILGAGLAVLAFQNSHRIGAEVAALLGLVAAVLALPVHAVVVRLRRYPERGRLELHRRGFRLPWLGQDSPGPEGPWEALRGYRVREGKKNDGSGRLLVLEVASGRMIIQDRVVGAEAFDAAVAALERALGPGGVLLGTVIRLPIHPRDTRPLLLRERPRLLALAAALAFGGLAWVASVLVVKVLAAAAALLAFFVSGVASAWNRSPGAELVLALDGLVVPVPDDLRRAVKLPFRALRRGALEDAGEGRVALVIEHERGRLQYPLDWFDPTEAREFARQLSLRSQ